MFKRNTIQCALVLEAVQTLQNHATADEIYGTIVRKYPSIGRATVYRNLNRLAEMGEIRKIEIPGGPDRYDHRCCKHYHAKCEKCGQVFDIDMDYIADLENRIKDAHGFKLTGHTIVFSGICPACSM